MYAAYFALHMYEIWRAESLSGNYDQERPLVNGKCSMQMQNDSEFQEIR